MRIRIAVLLMLGAMPWAQLHAQSQQVSTTIRVHARVEAGCEMTASDSNRHAITLLRATCTPDTTYAVGQNKGASRNAVSVNAIGADTIFGGVPAAQVLRTGDYADSITVQVYY